MAQSQWLLLVAIVKVHFSTELRNGVIVSLTFHTDLESGVPLKETQK